jgi:hypothetical protein
LFLDIFTLSPCCTIAAFYLKNLKKLTPHKNTTKPLQKILLIVSYATKPTNTKKLKNPFKINKINHKKSLAHRLLYLGCLKLEHEQPRKKEQEKQLWHYVNVQFTGKAGSVNPPPPKI